MICKGIIIVLTLATIATGLSWGASHVCFDKRVTALGSCGPEDPSPDITDYGASCPGGWMCIVDCNFSICLSPTENVRAFSVAFGRGSFLFRYWQDVLPYTSEEWTPRNYNFTPGWTRRPGGFGRIWIGLSIFVDYDDRLGKAENRVNVILPLCPIFLLFAAYPTIAFIRGPLRRWRRRRKGLCLKCAYDLTGNVSGMCPECGEEL